MTNSVHLKFDDLAPDLQLLNVQGKPVQLSALWKKGAIILAFTRHFGCPQCKEMVETLTRFQDELQSHDLSLALVTQGTPQAAKAFCSKYAPGVLCLADPDRNAYRAFGLERANLWQVFLSPKVWISNIKLLQEKGWRTEWPPKGQDAMQSAGIFIIGKDGRIRLPYYYDNISDHPPLDLISHGILGVDWKKPLEKPIVKSKPAVKNKSKK